MDNLSQGVGQVIPEFADGPSTRRLNAKAEKRAILALRIWQKIEGLRMEGQGRGGFSGEVYAYAIERILEEDEARG